MSDEPEALDERSRVLDQRDGPGGEVKPGDVERLAKIAADNGWSDEAKLPE